MCLKVQRLLTVGAACLMQTFVGPFEAEKLVESIRCYDVAKVGQMVATLCSNTIIKLSISMRHGWKGTVWQRLGSHLLLLWGSCKG